jgi:hypothetical protein
VAGLFDDEQATQSAASARYHAATVFTRRSVKA